MLFSKFFFMFSTIVTQNFRAISNTILNRPRHFLPHPIISLYNQSSHSTLPSICLLMGDSKHKVSVLLKVSINIPVTFIWADILTNCALNSYFNMLFPVYCVIYNYILVLNCKNVCVSHDTHTSKLTSFSSSVPCFTTIWCCWIECEPFWTMFFFRQLH
jgi:hypothetical protein